MESLLDATPLPSTQVCHTWALAHVGECVQVIHTLVLSTHVAPSDETTWILCFLHPPIKVDLPPYVDNFHLETKVILDWEEFVFVLVHSPCLSFGGLLNMVHELLWNHLVPDDSTNGLDLFLRYVGTLFEVMFHL